MYPESYLKPAAAPVVSLAAIEPELEALLLSLRDALDMLQEIGCGLSPSQELCVLEVTTYHYRAMRLGGDCVVL